MSSTSKEEPPKEVILSLENGNFAQNIRFENSATEDGLEVSPIKSLHIMVTNLESASPISP